ncbi:MAG: ROK family protein [Ignavibacteriaceae bacterium]|jgi:glucokinase|nr:ROK family protein [Ignavibacteriaceae bacterium]
MSKSEKYAIGVDLGGTYIKFGIVTENGKIVRKSFVDTKAEGGPDVVIKQMKKGLKELLDPDKIKIEGIGIGSPGIVSKKKGTVENPPNLPGWGKVQLGHLIEKTFKLPTFVENDANAAAIGELIFGAGKNYKSFVMITLGTGVGGGIILNKKLFRGDFGAAGEIGHITIDINGPKCGCGSYGCIEAYAGNSYLIQNTKEGLKNHQDSKIVELISDDFNALTPKVISTAAELGDPFANEVIKNLGRNIGFALASVSNLLDVSTFIIGGGVAGFGKLLLDNIEMSLKQRVLKSLVPRCKVLPAKLKNEAGIKGASSLVFYSI